MEAIYGQFKGLPDRRGSALVMVVVLTVLLALIASLFMLMSRVDEMATKSIQADRELDEGIDILVDRISEVLKDDVIDTSNNIRLNTRNKATEAWDYPKHRLDPGIDNLMGTYDDLAIDVGPDGILGTADDGTYYDDNDDVWLASLSPEMIDLSVDIGGASDYRPGFAHITDIYGTLAYLFHYGWDSGEYNSGNPASAYVDADGDRISFRNLRATIINPKDPVELGDKADADGDGVADSRWIAIPNLKSSKGETLFGAVRIVDNGGMINVNTAYRDPTDIRYGSTWYGGQWDGSMLGHVNLDGIRDVTETRGITDINAERFGAVTSTVTTTGFDDYLRDIEYEFYVARTLRKPFATAADEYYNPFGIGEELELRNRFFLSTSSLTTGTFTRTGLVWPATFNPLAEEANPGKAGRATPYKYDTDPVEYARRLAAWYDKAGPENLGLCNRRHFSTTYSFDRNIRPTYDDGVNTEDDDVLIPSGMTKLNWQRKIGFTLPQEIQEETASASVVEEYIKTLAAAVYRGMPIDSFISGRFGSEYDREKISWQMAVNLIDYQDDKRDFSFTPPTDLSEEVTKITSGDTTYFGTEDIDTLKADTLHISKLAYTEVDSSSVLSPLPVLGSYFAVEVFNPDDTDDKLLSDYELRIIDGAGNLKLAHALPAVTLTDSTGADNTGLIVFTNSIAPVNDAGQALSIVSAGIDQVKDVAVGVLNLSAIGTAYKIVVVETSTGLPVDSISIPSNLIAGGNAVRQRYRRMVFKGTNFLIPEWSSAGSDEPWEGFGVNPAAWMPGQRIDTSNFQDPTDPASPVYESDFAGLEKVQFDGPNQQLRSIGQMENVFAVGANYTETSGTVVTHKCRTLWQGVMDSLVAVKKLDSTADLTADKDTNFAGGTEIEMGSFGRIRLDDKDYRGLLDSFVYFQSPEDDNNLINVAYGKKVNGAVSSVITDGDFVTPGSAWNSAGTMNWNNIADTYEIDLGNFYYIYGAVIQADADDEYEIRYYDDSTGTWLVLWQVDDYPSLNGMQVRPDADDEFKWKFFPGVYTNKLEVKAVSGANFAISELKIGIMDNSVAGRININTAPWYVIKQLPWFGRVTSSSAATTPVPYFDDNNNLARAVVGFRDKTDLSVTTVAGGPDYSGQNGRGNVTGISGVDEDTGFTSVAQLMQIIDKNSTHSGGVSITEYDIRQYLDTLNDDSSTLPPVSPAAPAAPDYTPDNSTDDFEERNLLFHRISNLVTVRSDVFTAYIAVRIGADGPERRMMAIFDRSNVDSVNDKPRLVALHPVPDPR